MGEGSGRGSGRVRLFVGNRWSGRVGSGQRFAGSGRVGSKKSDPWTTLPQCQMVHRYNISTYSTVPCTITLLVGFTANQCTYLLYESDLQWFGLSPTKTKPLIFGRCASQASRCRINFTDIRYRSLIYGIVVPAFRGCLTFSGNNNSVASPSLSFSLPLSPLSRIPK